MFPVLLEVCFFLGAMLLNDGSAGNAVRGAQAEVLRSVVDRLDVMIDTVNGLDRIIYFCPRIQWFNV